MTPAEIKVDKAKLLALYSQAHILRGELEGVLELGSNFIDAS
jgi:hypothetical protein